MGKRSEALERAKSIIGEHDFGRALGFYKNLNGRKRMSDADFDQLVEDWKLMSALWETDIIGDLDSMVAEVIRIHNLGDIDTTDWTDDEKYAFVKEYREQFGVSVFTERLHKEQSSILKASLDDLTFNADGSITFDSSKAALFTPENVDVKAKYGKPEMRRVDTAEDGISRMLAEQGRSIAVFFLGQTADDPEAEKELREKKYNLFSHGCTDVATGTHYFFAFQNPSSTRKANFMFVQAQNFGEVKDMWLGVTGFKTWDEFMHSNLFNDKGECVYAKLLARVSTRGSNSFALPKLAKTEELQDILEEISGANIAYTGDTKWTIDRDFKTMVAPGSMELKNGKENKRTIKPGDGQMIGSFTFHARIAALLRIIKLDDYYEFLQLWNDVGCNFSKVKEGSRLWVLIQKIPEVFQLRHGEKKGISVRYNLEAIPELSRYDAIVPDSVRKFVGGEWSEYPLEICNWLKKREGWVAMNPQFIESLALEPQGLKPIADYWLDKMEKALSNTMDMMDYLKMMSSSMDTEASAIDDNNAWSVGIVQQALWANASLIHEKQIRNWLTAQFQKMVNDMRIGRILVPGMYTYMVCDPAFIINRLFHDASYQKMRDERGLPTMAEELHELKAEEYYFNGRQDVRVALFRSPLIHPFETQLVNTVNDKAYAYMANVIVFNGYDGRWDRMGGGDFDGDQAAAVPEDSEFGKIICDAVRIFDYDIYEDGLSAQKHVFTDDGLFNYLADNAKRDRTGILTNHASRCLDLSNSLIALKSIAMSMGINRIRLLHPQLFGENGYGFFGSQYTYSTVMDGDEAIVVARGYVEYDNKTKDWCPNGLVGDYTLDQIQGLADYYLGLVEILRLLQGREIDGAKTGVYAEGVSGEDYIDAVKVPFTPHCMMTRQEVLGKPISEKSKKNTFHTFSPLGFLCDYITYQTTSKEEGGAGRILDELKNGVNMAIQMYCCLTPEEQEFFNISWMFTDGKQRTLIDIMSERKAAYNTALYNMNQGNLSKEESSDLLRSIKENERSALEQLAGLLGCPLTVMAVAAYSVAYSRTNRQNSGLTYGWILPATNLEVFSRANKAFRLIRLRGTEINFVKVMNGELYVDGERIMSVNAHDGYAPIRVIDGCPCALLHKKTDTVPQTVATNMVYTIGTLGLAHYIGKLINNTDNNTMVASWMETMRQNNFEFDITEEANGQVVISINGCALSALLMNNAHIEQIAPLLGKRVRIVNDKNGPIDQQVQWKPGTNTINNLRVVVVGNAQ